jgi:hypothetical protein
MPMYQNKSETTKYVRIANMSQTSGLVKIGQTPCVLG